MELATAHDEICEFVGRHFGILRVGIGRKEGQGPAEFTPAFTGEKFLHQTRPGHLEA